MVKSVPHFKYFSSALKAPLKTTDYKAKKKKKPKLQNPKQNNSSCLQTGCLYPNFQTGKYFLSCLGNKL